MMYFLSKVLHWLQRNLQQLECVILGVDSLAWMLQLVSLLNYVFSHSFKSSGYLVYGCREEGKGCCHKKLCG